MVSRHPKRMTTARVRARVRPIGCGVQVECKLEIWGFGVLRAACTHRSLDRRGVDDFGQLLVPINISPHSDELRAAEVACGHHNPTPR